MPFILNPLVSLPTAAPIPAIQLVFLLVSRTPPLNPPSMAIDSPSPCLSPLVQTPEVATFSYGPVSTLPAAPPLSITIRQEPLFSVAQVNQIQQIFEKTTYPDTQPQSQSHGTPPYIGGYDFLGEERAIGMMLDIVYRTERFFTLDHGLLGRLFTVLTGSQFWRRTSSLSLRRRGTLRHPPMRSATGLLRRQ